MFHHCTFPIIRYHNVGSTRYKSRSYQQSHCDGFVGTVSRPRGAPQQFYFSSDLVVNYDHMSIEGLLRIQLGPSMTNGFIDWINVIALLAVVMSFLACKVHTIVFVSLNRSIISMCWNFVY